MNKLRKSYYKLDNRIAQKVAGRAIKDELKIRSIMLSSEVSVADARF